MQGAIGGGFWYRFALDIDWGEFDTIPQQVLDCLAEQIVGATCLAEDFLPDLTVDFDVKAGASASLTYEGVSFTSYEKPLSLGEIPLQGFPIGPLYFEPSVEISGKTYGQATSQFKLGSKVSVTTGAGVEVSTKSGVHPSLDTPSTEFDALDVEATLGAKTGLRVGPALHLRLYGVTGPWAALQAYAELRADRESSPCWELEAGVDFDLGFDVVVKDVPVVDEVRLANWSESYPIESAVVDSGDCAPLPNSGTPLAVGGEPSDQAFSEADFDPWSSAWQGAVVSHPVEEPGAQLEWSDITPTIDGRFLITGSNTDALVKVDPEGALVWAKHYVPPEPINETTTLDDLLPSRVIDSGDARMLLLAHPYTVAKIEAGGDVVWAKRFDVPHEQDDLRFTGIARAPKTGFYIAGTRGDDPNASSWRAWVLKTDELGTPQWSKTWASPETQTNLRNAIAYADGVVAVGDVYDPELSAWYGLVARFDDDGELVWAKHLMAPDCNSEFNGSVHLMTALESADGDLIIAGSTGIAPYGTLIMKLKPDGELAWESRETSPSPHLGPVINDVVQLPTGGYLATGTFDYWVSGGGHQEVWLGALDGVGRLLWMKRYGGQRDDTTPRFNDSYSSLLLTQDGGAIVAAFTDSLTPEGKGLWAFKSPAKNGVIEFDPESAAETYDLTWEDDSRYCLMLEDADLELENEQSQPEPFDLSVESASVESFSETP